MRHLKNYKLFKEETEFDVQLTDEPDVKGAKDELNNMHQNLSDFQAQKKKIDDAYLKASTDADLKLKLEEIIGKENKNPFITEYLHVASLKRKVQKFQNDIANDKIKQDDLKQELSIAEDPTVKQSLTDKTKEITDRLSTNKVTIGSLMKDINDGQVALDKKIKDMEKSMMDNVKKLNQQSSK